MGLKVIDGGLAEAEQPKRWAKSRPPVVLPFVEDYGGGMFPECPTCHEMPYSTKECYWCGQRFIQDKTVKEHAIPHTEQGTCPNCGAPVEIQIANSNNHRSYHCNECGCTVMS